MRSLFPQLADIRIESEWFGMIGMTSDNMPRFHKLSPNVISFSGYNGRGIAPGTVFGYVLAHYINGNLTDDQLPLPVTDPREPPLRRLSEAFYEIGAQIAHIASARRIWI
jgi:glycine/D-amino acid oxidase-like deaminating enzyme